MFYFVADMNAFLNKKSVLEKRQKIVRVIRDYLFENGYLELQVPLLIRGTNPDAFLTSLEVFENNAARGYLTTSTEFQLLRLLANGFEKVYTLTQNFRAGDQDLTHHQEFTMLEWEARDVSMAQIEKIAEIFIQRAFSTLFPAAESIEYGGQTVRLIGAPWKKLTVREALKKYLDLEIAADFSLESFIKETKKIGLKVPTEFLNDRGLLFSYLIDSLQNKLGLEAPTWVTEWPLFQTSMAEPMANNPAAADRSELYIAGLEIANGFTTVCGIAKQRALFDKQQKERIRQGKKPVTVDEKYLADLEGKNLKAAGLALGLDRLVMILTGKKDISEVVAFGLGELW